MQVIHETCLMSVDRQSVPLPVGAKILAVTVLFGRLSLWAMVDPGAQFEQRGVTILRPGMTVPGDAGMFVTTLPMDDFVLHVFVQ